MFHVLKNEKGMALLSVYLVSALITTISTAAYGKAFFEMRQIDREVNRLKSFAAAEAGLQNAMAQIGNNAYTGFINTTALSVANFQSVDGTAVGNYSVDISYPDQADWVIVTSTATVNGETRKLEGRIFLDSNFSKYLVYANTSNFSSGTDAQYGEPDMTDAYGDGTPDYPQFVPANEDDRAALYFTGTWTISGTGVQLYGDAHAQTSIAGNSSSYVHGDTYVGNFTKTSSAVTNSGVTGSLNVGDGFSDDVDRTNDGSVSSTDYPDYHDLTAQGGNGDHKTETLVAISHSFYAANNNISAFAGSTAVDRFLKFEAINGGTQTLVRSYTSATFATQSATYTLPASAIVYVKGDIYVKGEIGGRVSVVSSDDIFIDGNFTYPSAQMNASATQSAALLAKDKMFFRANDLTVSGILYAENSGNNSVAMDADYNTSGVSSPSTKNSLNLSGNRIMNGSTNLGNYDDRVYGYDSNLKYYRPPGIPVAPDLRTVRDVSAV
jgi:hypothetical protein